MILYLDTSALVKRYIRETASDEVIALIEQAGAVGSTSLTRVEMAAALEKAARLGWIERETALGSWNDFLDHWLSVTRLSITTGTLTRASTLAWEYSLRGYDAVHLAAALHWQETLAAPVTLATFDRDLWLAGREAGMGIWPEGLVA
ncbi:MAG: type II toxin-antitoxin system VapC family toxin [Anaerolineales bacterium]|nr:type II toxin-antitoxin system VapC family toxin [Anaerolineales bacterium]